MSTSLPNTSEFQLDRRGATYSDCPNCGYKNALAVTRTRGRTLYHCHAGCSQESLWRAICDLGPAEPGPVASLSPRPAGAEEYARLLWTRSLPARGSTVEEYLKKREISGPLPSALRYLPEHLHSPTDTKWPVMLASVVDFEGRLRAVHRTYLSKEGRGKSPVMPARMTLGSVGGYSCHLADAGERLAVAEGIETALSFQLMTGIPTWAALSTGGLRALLLPPLPLARLVTIAADADRPGLRAADRAAERWQAEGREVRIIVPPRPGMDFNDLLIGARL